MEMHKRISALELTLSLAVGAFLAVYRHLWAGEKGLGRAVVGLAAALLLTVFALYAEKARARVSAPAPAGRGCMTLLAASGFVLLLSAALFWMEGKGAFTLLTLLRAVFPAACGAAALVRLKHGDRDRLSAMLCLFPVFYLCFFLLLFYRANGDGPDVSVYGFETAAVIAALLGVYAHAAVRFDKPRPGLRAAAFSIGTAAAAMELVLLVLDRTMLLGISGYGWGTAAMLLGMGLQLCAALICPGEKLPAAEPDKAEDEAGEEAGEKPAAEEKPAEEPQPAAEEKPAEEPQPADKQPPADKPE